MQKPSSDSLLLDRLVPADLPGVADIEAREPSGWNMEMIRSELAVAGGTLLVARGSGIVVGWLCGRRVGEQAELLKITVGDGYRRRRVGTRLLSRMIDECVADGVEKLFLEVRSLNRAAVEFYEEFGFAEVGRRKGYYKRPSDDAVVMELKILEKGHGVTIR